MYVIGLYGDCSLPIYVVTRTEEDGAVDLGAVLLSVRVQIGNT